jgi:head-tail adaptor
MIGSTRNISIQRRTRVPDAQGGWSEGWDTIAAESGKVRPASGSEREVAGQPQATVTHIAYLRGKASVRFGDRLYLDEIGYEVVSCRYPGGGGTRLEIDLTQIQTGRNP